MKRLAAALRLLALVLLLTACITWLATGAHPGWTKTQITEMQLDEITGIEGPVYRPGFVMGVELLAIGIAAAGTLFAISFLIGRKRSPLSHA
jgi:hypothetical protein